MSVITFANNKGGVGKTTYAFALALALAREEHKVTILDLGETYSYKKFEYNDLGEMCGEKNIAIKNLPVIDNVEIIAGIDGRCIDKYINDARKHSEFIIIDTKKLYLEGTMDAVKMSDLVILPTEHCIMSTEVTVKTIDEIRSQCKKLPIAILPFRLDSPLKIRRTIDRVVQAMPDANILTPFGYAFEFRETYRSTFLFRENFKRVLAEISGGEFVEEVDNEEFVEEIDDEEIYRCIDEGKMFAEDIKKLLEDLKDRSVFEVELSNYDKERKTISVPLPRYILSQLKIKACKERKPSNALIIKALKKDGFKVDDHDLIDPRKARYM